MREIRQGFDEFQRWLYDPETGSFESADGLSREELDEAEAAGKQVVGSDERHRIEAQNQPGSG